MYNLKRGDGDEAIELPPGFRFHPTDEELVTHYLSPKSLDSSFTTKAIAEVDLNKVEPWDLPWKAKIGEKEWYFFSERERKYPSGLRTNRATDAGYWKATGKDKEIFQGKVLVGMKKTLVFYRGRAPAGHKTNWVMHEYYRLQGKTTSIFSSKNEWVVCRIFKKSCGGKKVDISGLNLPPLMDLSCDETQSRTGAGAGAESGSHHVTCFSNIPTQDESGRYTNFPCFPSQITSSDQSIMLHLLLETNPKPEFSGIHSTDKLSAVSNNEVGLFKHFVDQRQDFHPIISTEFDCLWNY